MPRSWRWSIFRSTLERRRRRALIAGSTWAARAAAMRASWTPTATERPSALVVQEARSAQAAQTSAGETKRRAGRPLWSVWGRASAGVAPPGGGAGGPSATLGEIGFGGKALFGDRGGLGARGG